MYRKHLLRLAAALLAAVGIAAVAGCSRRYWGITASALRQTLPIPAPIEGGTAGGEYGICRISVMNLREEGAYEAEAATQTLMGCVVRVLDHKNGWAMVSTPEGYVAWVTEGSLFFTDEAGVISWKARPRLIVTSRYATLLSAPKKGSAIVRDAVRGCIVANLGPEGRYFKCSLPDGTQAYIERRDAAPCREYFESQHPTGEQIVTVAKQYMGIPYMWGGTSIKAVDCSGLSQRVYMDCGILLPRNASQQARSGDEVDISGGWGNLQPGDLLFFGRPRSGGGTSIYHVAIYIGDGQIIHSCAARVQFDGIIPGRADYFAGSSNIVCARRILGSEDCGKGVWSILANGWYF